MPVSLCAHRVPLHEQEMLPLVERQARLNAAVHITPCPVCRCTITIDKERLAAALEKYEATPSAARDIEETETFTITEEMRYGH